MAASFSEGSHDAILPPNFFFWAPLFATAALSVHPIGLLPLSSCSAASSFASFPPPLPAGLRHFLVLLLWLVVCRRQTAPSRSPICRNHRLITSATSAASVVSAVRGHPSRLLREEGRLHGNWCEPFSRQAWSTGTNQPHCCVLEQQCVRKCSQIHSSLVVIGPPSDWKVVGSTPCRVPHV